MCAFVFDDRCRKNVRLTPTEVKTYENQLGLFQFFHPFAIILIQNFQRSIPAYLARNTANAMIKQHLVRAFERGAGRDHRPNIGLQRYICEVFHGMEDSNM
jgi:hypothetical protein